ncbi:MAG: hypothetical protein PHH70_01275 [Candidatus Gracilibacteria bacterium]|nr:hypothetical protein [Candidatus Gracilibacteria bacterium]
MGYTILEENSRSVLVRMPKSYLSRLDAVQTPKTRQRVPLADNIMTPKEHKRYLEAKRDLENGVNIISGTDFIKQFNLR